LLAREPEQFRALVEARENLAENADSLGGLFDFVDPMSPAVVDGATTAVDGLVATVVAAPLA
jgi:hypothetical protein